MRWHQDKPMVGRAAGTRWGLFFCVFECFTVKEVCLVKEIAA